MKMLRAIFRWAGQQQMLFILLALSASGHALALMVVKAELMPPEFPPTESPTRIEWRPELNAGPLETPRWGTVTEVLDPSLIADGGDRGFSARKSAGMTAVVYQWPRHIQQSRLTETSLIQEVRVPTVAEPSLHRLMAARLGKVSGPSFEEVGDVFLERPASPPALELRGALRDRRLLQPFQLPELGSAAPSAPSVFRVAVDADGWVRIVILESSSGNDEADSKAADALRRCKFAVTTAGPQPLTEDAAAEQPQPAHEWGRAIVMWPKAPAADEKGGAPIPQE